MQSIYGTMYWQKGFRRNRPRPVPTRAYGETDYGSVKNYTKFLVTNVGKKKETSKPGNLVPVSKGNGTSVTESIFAPLPIKSYFCDFKKQVLSRNS